MKTRAVRDGSDWVLSGSKMWITNGSIADIAVVWARTEDGIRGFLVPRGRRGFTSRNIHKKLSLRASVTAELHLDDVKLPAGAMLPGVSGLKGPLSCLSEARYGIAWGVTGAARACLEAAVDYARTREQFGKPLATFQSVAGEAADIYIASRTLHLAALSACWRLSAGRDAAEDADVAAYWLAQEAPAAMRTCHQLHGGIGLDISYPLHRYSAMVSDLARFVGGAEYRLDVLAQGTGPETGPAEAGSGAAGPGAPPAARGEASTSSSSPMITSSGTSSPCTMNTLARLPRSVPRAAASRSRRSRRRISASRLTRARSARRPSRRSRRSASGPGTSSRGSGAWDCSPFTGAPPT